MVQSLEQYVAQATQAYAPSTTAVQNQIDALAGQLEATNAQINKNYARQQASLDRSRNQATETASMQAAGSGGSFGGAANLANRKYYEQSYVPAVVSLQGNQANALESAKQSSDQNRTSLQTQLASLQSQAYQQALSQYYSDLEAERQREYEAQQAELNRQAQIAAAKASAAASSAASSYYNAAARSSSNSVNKNITYTQWLNSTYASPYASTAELKNAYAQYNATAKLANSSSAATRKIGSGLLNKLEQTNLYKQYLNWRNS